MPEVANPTAGANGASGANGAPALELRGVSKSYGAVVALQDVSFSLHGGTVVGLLGDNGAGKSTLVKCISGMVRPDSGQILIDGKEVQLDSAATARSLGIETVHQGLALVNTLDIASNLFLNRELIAPKPPLRWTRWLDKGRMRREAEVMLEELGVSVRSIRASVEDLSGGQRQAIAIARAVGWGQPIVLMDEPASALGVKQSKHVLDLTLRLREKGVAVLFISHNMEHVIEVCDEAVVLRHGRKLAEVKVADVASRDLVDLITGASSEHGPRESR